jgi:serine/threonine protein kinase
VDIQLKGRGVSRRHALVELGEDGLLVHDLGSRNGTLVDGVPVEAEGPAGLISGQGVIRIGGYDLHALVSHDPTSDATVAAQRTQVQSLVQPAGIEVRYLIGKGATGSVWAGWQAALGRMVAVKVLEGFDPEDRQRFLREGKVASRLDSPHVVKLYDLQIERDRPYLIMELIPGMSALERLAEGPIPLHEVLDIGVGVASALTALEQAGVVHRDVKPGNVLLVPDGTAKLTDFGIAKDLEAKTILTQAGIGLGTFSYIAPEQFLEARDVTASADLYGLGATLYHLLAGRPPFVYSGRGSPAMLLEQIASEPPPPLSQLAPDVPRDVRRLVEALLEKDPADRPRGAGVVFAALGDLRRVHAPAEDGSAIDPMASTRDDIAPPPEAPASA